MTAPATFPFVDYNPSNEAIELERRKQDLESSLEGLTAAIRNHHRLQNELSKLLTDRDRKPQSPASTPAFDLAFVDHDGSVVVVEVKSATPSNLEGQLRLGLGQVLRYAHQLSTSFGAVRAAILIQLEPSDEWKRLLDDLGIDLLYETDLAAGLDLLLRHSPK